MSVVIPSRGGADGLLPRCARAVLDQADGGVEILLSIDAAACPPSIRELGRDRRVTILTGPTGGPGVARNRALRIARGRLVLFLNDDVVPCDGLLQAHEASHDSEEHGGPRLVLGDAPFAIPPDDRGLDRVVRETPLLFFYSEMDARDPQRDWGFRHAWTLNLSLPRAICQRFDERLRHPMFDDLEWAHRVQRATAAPVVYRPGGRGMHEHRYTPAAIARREALLGHQAACLARANPACARAVFGDRFDLTDRAADDARATLADRAAAERAYAEFVAQAERSAASIDPRRVYESAWPWRRAARAAGYLSAIAREDVHAACASAMRAIGVAVAA
ncbi:MAG: glycosyltransferase family A protein [Planctomycetota bacterium]